VEDLHLSVVAKRANATGMGDADACTAPAACRCGIPQGQRDERARRDELGLWPLVFGVQTSLQ
jgi:hypothetical protein